MAKDVLKFCRFLFIVALLSGCASGIKISSQPDLETFPSEKMGTLSFYVQTPDESFEIVLRDDSTGLKIQLKNADGKVNLRLPAGQYSLHSLRIVEQKEQVSSNAPMQWTVESGKTVDGGIILNSCSDWNDDSDTTQAFREYVHEKREWTHVFPYGECLLFWKNPVSASSQNETPAPAKTETKNGKSNCVQGTELVKTYLKKDYDGEFLKNSTWLKSNTDSSLGEFDSVQVIRSFEIGKCSELDGILKIQAQVEVLGTVTKQDSKNKIEDIQNRRFKKVSLRFELKESKGRLLLNSESLPLPHVGIDAVKQWLAK